MGIWLTAFQGSVTWLPLIYLTLGYQVLQFNVWRLSHRLTRLLDIGIGQLSIFRGSVTTVTTDWRNSCQLGHCLPFQEIYTYTSHWFTWLLDIGSCNRMIFYMTRPKPAYGQQGLGLDLNVSVCSLAWIGGPQLTSFDPKTWPSRTRGPNQPFRCLNCNSQWLWGRHSAKPLTYLTLGYWVCNRMIL